MRCVCIEHGWSLEWKSDWESWISGFKDKWANVPKHHLLSSLHLLLLEPEDRYAVFSNTMTENMNEMKNNYKNIDDIMQEIRCLEIEDYLEFDSNMSL